MSTKKKKVLSLFLALVMVFSLLPGAALATQDDTSEQATSDTFMKIVFLDCGRKYFSVDSIKKIIDNAADAGFNYIQLAVGNDGLRFLLDDMSLTVNGTTYTSDQVSDAIHSGNEAYYNFTTDELTQSEMDTIIGYANEKGLGVIPCINTPGHMDAILAAANSLTGTTCSYNGSARTIDVTNSTAVAFTQALLQKYITYFAGKGCTYFNMGADEYANDKYTSGSMGFGNLQSTGKYSYYVQYVNQVAALIKNAKMTPMAFNDGIYFNSNTSSGTFDTNIVICYWSNGWDGYTPMPAADLAAMGFKLINTHGSYYWVLGKSDWQCDAATASGFDYKAFQGGTIDDPTGAMFCIWCDYPGAGTEATVINSTAATITAFGKTLPQKPTINVTGLSLSKVTAGKIFTLSLSDGSSATWSSSDESVIKLSEVATQDIAGATSVQAEAVGEGTATITATYAGGTVTQDITVKAAADKKVVEIELAVGETKTETQEGVDNSKNVDRSNLNASIATVNVDYTKVEGKTETVLGEKQTLSRNGTYEGVIYDESSHYMVVDSNGNISSTTDINQATQFTVTQSGNGNNRTYTIKTTSGDRWLTMSRSQTNSGFPPSYSYSLETSPDSATLSYSSSNGFSQSFGTIFSTTAYMVYNNGWTVSTSTPSTTSPNPGFLYSTTTKTTDPVDATTITFTGVAPGTTQVTVGDIVYNITVVDKAPSGALTDDSITLEYWITNYPVYDADSETTGNHTKSITTSMDGATSDEGIAISSLAPDPAYSFFDGTKTVYYWQAMRLDADNIQTNASGDDETADGTTLTHVRYHGGAWQYQTTNDTWHYFVSTDQLVAYYLQKTEVTQEVDTYVKDWGYGTGGTTEDSSSGKGQVALTVAVVYPDGTVSPTEDDMYANSTTIFNYWDGRDIGIVAPANNSDYTISKITVTDGKRNDRSDNKDTSRVWYNDDEITWNKKTLDSGAKWYDETEVWNKDNGTTPMVNGRASNITWSEKNTAKLVLIYLEPVEKKTNLNLVYWDKTDDTQITEMQIAMSYATGDPTPSYITALKNAGGSVIGSTKDWPGTTSSDTGYLPDDAYVTNSSNVDQTFNKDLPTVATAPAVYKTGLYKYVGAKISEDGKTLTLYYELDSTKLSKTYVVDYGLPVTIPASDFIQNLDNIKDVVVSTPKFGTVQLATDKKSLTYTPTNILTAQETITLKVTYTDNKTNIFTIGILPASTMYYEQDFGTDFITYDGSWSKVFSNETQANATVYQALSALGSKDNYGYDDIYQAYGQYSRDSAQKVTVSSTDSPNWPTATFSFKGTGFDIISLTDSDSGAIFVTVKDKSGTAVKNFMVNNYYGYEYNENTTEWTASPQANNALYQIPVMKVSNLTYGDYTVEIKVAYSSLFDLTGDSAYSFWLDAIRIYDPMGEYADYTKDNEGYPVYTNLHKALIKNDATIKENAVFIDGKGNATLSEYTNYGPNNEIYLKNGQAVSFKLTGDLSKIASVQIGAKAPQGTATMVVNESTTAATTLSTATDMYYDITNVAKDGNVVIISNTAEKGILSLTNLKITFTEKGSVNLDSLSDADTNAALKVVRSVFAAEAPVIEPFVPERFEAKWDRSVRAGQRATLTVKTSEDVAAISVDGQVIDSYRTYTERSGWGWNAARVTYRVFTYTVTPTETTDYTVAALNSDGVASTPITATLTVTTQRPGGWWGNGWWY